MKGELNSGRGDVDGPFTSLGDPRSAALIIRGTQIALSTCISVRSMNSSRVCSGYE